MTTLQQEPGSFTPPAQTSRFYPNLVTGKFYETWNFYTEKLGFRTVAEHTVYVHLIHPCGAQLGILQEEMDGQPEELICATRGRGFWLSYDVDDVDAEFARLLEADVELVAPIEERPWGERVFVIRDPNGVLIYVAGRLCG